jgi:cytochrome bd-I ubiquinol oxidase subunit X
MWYFSWILGTGLALAFGVLNAIWYEIIESQRAEQARIADTPLPIKPTPETTTP